MTAGVDPVLAAHAEADLVARVRAGERLALARLLSRIEAESPGHVAALYSGTGSSTAGRFVGVTGPPGAGKSTLVAAMTEVLVSLDRRVGVLAVDPSSPLSGGALLGDRVRMMRHVDRDDVFIRSLANRGSLGGVARAVAPAIVAMVAGGFEDVIVETVGVGQAEVDVVDHVDTTVVVTTPGLGDDVQAIKAGVLEIADVLVVNKSDLEGARAAVSHLRSMLLLQGDRQGWRVPIVLTRADSGDGVPELLEAVDAHRRHLADTGELTARRRARIEARLRALVLTELEAAADALLASAWGTALRDEVASLLETPGGAADRALAALGVQPVGGAQIRHDDEEAR